MKAFVYLCSEHARDLKPKEQLIDDILICQEINCFTLAGWRYVVDVPQEIAETEPIIELQGK